MKDIYFILSIILDIMFYEVYTHNHKRVIQHNFKEVPK